MKKPKEFWELKTFASLTPQFFSKGEEVKLFWRSDLQKKQQTLKFKPKPEFSNILLQIL